MSQEYKKNREQFFKAMTPEEIINHQNKLKEQKSERIKSLRSERIKKV
jgi:hypothetical protein